MQIFPEPPLSRGASGARPESRRIVFDSGHLLERGTDVALWDYAHFNEAVLGNESWIACPARAPIPCLDRFRERFTVVLYRNDRDLAGILENADLFYRQVHGRPNAAGDPRARPARGRVGIHCVFKADRPHGDVYASISDWVSDHHGDPELPRVPVVPYIAHLPRGDGTDLRAELGIPDDAVVFGRHGGAMTFDIPFVRATVQEIVKRRADLWFLMWNTERFCEPHPRIVHLPPSADPSFKVRFVDSCDAMLHARAEGETFGLAVAEFSLRDKPVLTWGGSPDRHHLDVLGERALVYRGIEDLARTLMRWDKARPPAAPAGGWDAFSERFGPEPVMRTFAEVFLDAPIDSRAGVPAGRARSPLRLG